MRTDGERPARSVLTNPGGPGGPGLSLPAVLGVRPALAATEVVGVDVRGTGASSTVTCLPAAADLTAAPDPRDRSPEAVAATQDLARRTAQACQQDPLSAFVTTEQTVADLDLVRDALDRDTIDWVGYSGGTWLGAQYATYFPGRVGRFVLDSNTDVTGPFQRVFAEHQPPAFQRRFAEDFQPWAARYPWLFRLGATPAEVDASYERLRADLAARPVVVPVLGLRIDGALLDGIVAQAMYSKTSFESLAWTMRALRVVSDLLASGDRTGAERASAGLAQRVLGLLPDAAAPEEAPAADAAQATFFATTCNDTAWSRGGAFWAGLGERQGSRFPLVGWSKALQPCAYWERPALSLPAPDGRDLPPVLLVQTEHDPATSYEGALRTRAALPSSRLVTVAGDGDHGVYGAAGNPCVDDLVDAFLTTGAAPDGDVTCATTGVPAPGSGLLGSVQLRDALTR
nr:alpha/beta hydrolase [Kineococcus siccus]